MKVSGVFGETSGVTFPCELDVETGELSFLGLLEDGAAPESGVFVATDGGLRVEAGADDYGTYYVTDIDQLKTFSAPAECLVAQGAQGGERSPALLRAAAVRRALLTMGYEPGAGTQMLKRDGDVTISVKTFHLAQAGLWDEGAAPSFLVTHLKSGALVNDAEVQDDPARTAEEIAAVLHATSWRDRLYVQKNDRGYRVASLKNLNPISPMYAREGEAEAAAQSYDATHVFPDPTSALRLSADEETVIREILTKGERAGDAEFVIGKLAAAGGYSAIVDDESRWDDFGDLIDPLVNQRIVDVRNALRDHGWDDDGSSPMRSGALKKGPFELGYVVKKRASNLINAAFTIKGVVGFFMSDNFTRSAAEMASRIDLGLPSARLAVSPLDQFEMGGGEPWQVTRARWVEIMRGHMESLGQSPDPQATYEEFHRSTVKRALDDGQVIPADVLADYPDVRAETPGEKAARYAAAESRLARALDAMAGPDVVADPAPNPARDLPFMLATDGKMVVYSPDGTRVLPKDWTGLAVSAENVNQFWYLARDGDERSFTMLQAGNYADAMTEVESIKASAPMAYGLTAAKTFIEKFMDGNPSATMVILKNGATGKEEMVRLVGSGKKAAVTRASNELARIADAQPGLSDHYEILLVAASDLSPLLAAEFLEARGFSISQEDPPALLPSGLERRKAYDVAIAPVEGSAGGAPRFWKGAIFHGLSDYGSRGLNVDVRAHFTHDASSTSIDLLPADVALWMSRGWIVPAGDVAPAAEAGPAAEDLSRVRYSPYNPDQVEMPSAIELGAKVRVGSVTKVRLNAGGAGWTNGHFLDKGGLPPTVSKVVEDVFGGSAHLDRVPGELFFEFIESAKLLSTTPVVPMANFFRGDDQSPVVVLGNRDLGVAVMLNKRYHDYFALTYPGAEFLALDAASPVAVRVKGNVVGVVSPVLRGASMEEMLRYASSVCVAPPVETIQGDVDLGLAHEVLYGRCPDREGRFSEREYFVAVYDTDGIPLFKETGILAASLCERLGSRVANLVIEDKGQGCGVAYPVNYRRLTRLQVNPSPDLVAFAASAARLIRAAGGEGLPAGQEGAMEICVRYGVAPREYVNESQKAGHAGFGSRPVTEADLETENQMPVRIASQCRRRAGLEM